MYESIHVRITEEQYEWLRRYCFENRVAQAEVVREAVDMLTIQIGDKVWGEHEPRMTITPRSE